MILRPSGSTYFNLATSLGEDALLEVTQAAALTAAMNASEAQQASKEDAAAQKIQDAMRKRKGLW